MYLEVRFEGEGPRGEDVVFGLDGNTPVYLWNGFREYKTEDGESEVIESWVEAIGLDRILDKAILRSRNIEPDAMTLAKSAKEYALVEEA